MGYGDLLHSGWWMTYPSERSWTSSVGMIIPFPTEWKNRKNVPKHQPDGVFTIC
jgi:hypothetical protein